MEKLEVPSEWDVELMLRPGTSGDVPFITNSWLTSFRDSCHVWGVPNDEYYGGHHRVLEEIIPDSVVLVLCEETHPGHIAGYVVYETLQSGMWVHYMYLKRKFRGTGLGRMMYETVLDLEKPERVGYTHRTKKLWQIYKAKNPNWTYNPYMLYHRDWAKQ